MRLISAKCPKMHLNFIHAVNAKRENDGERPPAKNRKRKCSSFAKKRTKIPGKRFALPGMAFLPVPIPALAAGRRAVVTICKKTMRLYPMGRNDTRGFGPRPALRSAILPPLPRRLGVRPLRRLPDRGGKDLDFTARSASWQPGWNCPAGGAPGTYCPALFAAGGR